MISQLQIPVMKIILLQQPVYHQKISRVYNFLHLSANPIYGVAGTAHASGPVEAAV